MTKIKFAFKSGFLLLLLIAFNNLSAQLVTDNCDNDTTCVKNVFSNFSFQLIEVSGAPFDPNPCPIESYLEFKFVKGVVYVYSTRYTTCSRTSDRHEIAQGKYTLSKKVDGKLNITMTALPSILEIQYQYSTNLTVSKSNASNTYELRFKKDRYSNRMILVKGVNNNVPEIAEYNLITRNN